MRLGRMSGTTISQWQSRGDASNTDGNRKSGQVLVRTLRGKNSKPDAAGTHVRHDNFPVAVAGGCEWHGRRLKKRTGFGSHPGRQKLKPDAAGTHVRHDNFPVASRGGCEWHRRRSKKRTGFGSHSEGTKNQARCGRGVSSASDFPVTYNSNGRGYSYNGKGDGIACFIVRVISRHFSKAVCQEI